MDTMEQFDKFNEDLKNNEYFRNDVRNFFFISKLIFYYTIHINPYLYRLQGFELTTLVDKDNVLARSYVQMLKKFLTKNLAIKFTAVRVSTDKSKVQFRGNEFSKCMDGK